MNYPKISIVTPSFNQGHFIEETILSVINQDYPNIEYILIDGGSTDNTIEIIKKYSDRIAYWVSEKDNGQSEAINKGFKVATGEIVGWLNSDDILMPGALTSVMEYFSNHKEIDFLNGYTLVMDIQSKILYNYFILKQKKWYAKHGVYYISQPSMFWKINLFDKIGYLKEDFHARMDQEFLIRILKNDCKIGQVKKILAGFRVHNASKTFFSGQIWTRDEKELFNLYSEDYGRKPKLFFKIIYGLEKIIKLNYLKQYAFMLKWKGKEISKLNPQNCNYL